MLAVYPLRDEARRALRFIDRIGESPFYTIQKLSVLSGLALAAYPYIEWFRLLQPLIEKTTPMLHFVVVVPIAILVILPSLFLILHIPHLVIPIVRRLGYWDDSPFSYLHTRLFVSPVPAASTAAPGETFDEGISGARAYSITRTISGPALLHSAIYEEDDVIRDVVCWMSEHRLPEHFTSIELARGRSEGAGQPEDEKVPPMGSMPGCSVMSVVADEVAREEAVAFRFNYTLEPLDWRRAVDTVGYLSSFGFRCCGLRPLAFDRHSSDLFRIAVLLLAGVCLHALLG